MNKLVTVIVPTHNPDVARLSRVLAALEQQSLAKQNWELIIVDNASAAPFAPILKQRHLCSSARVLREPKLGLTFARVAGFLAARGKLVVLCDDDNVLAPDYLAKAVQFSRAHPDVGVFGGKSLPWFEVDPPTWFAEAAVPFGCRDRGEREEVARPEQLEGHSRVTHYPPCAPIGAGMVLLHEVTRIYRIRVASGDVRLSDRRGTELSAGGDCDIVLTALNAGWAVAYTPLLSLTHIIPARRLEPSYVARLAREGSRSWVKLLSQYGISSSSSIAPWTLPLRKARAWLRLRAWRGPVEKIRWHGACGVFEGRALLQ